MITKTGLLINCNSDEATEASKMALYVEGDDSDFHLSLLHWIEKHGDVVFTVLDLSKQMRYQLSEDLLTRMLTYMQQEGLVKKLKNAQWRLEI